MTKTNKLAGPFLGAAMLLGGCVGSQGASYMSEDAAYNTQRGPFQNAPVNCTVVTNESGRVYGGTVVYEPGNARRTCVTNSGPRAAINDARRTMDDVGEIVRDGIYLQRNFQRMLRLGY